MFKSTSRYSALFFVVFAFACTEKNKGIENSQIVTKAPQATTEVTSVTASCDNQVIDGKHFIVCSDGSKVQVVSGIDGSSCAAVEESDGMYIVCDDGTTIKVGAKPKPTSNTQCTAKDNIDGTYTVSCPDGTGFTVSNGKDGKDGKDGTNGKDGKDGVDGASHASVDTAAFYRERIGSVPKIYAVKKYDDGSFVYQWHGSGVVVADNVVVTNYHVCQILDLKNIVLESNAGYHYEMMAYYPAENVSGPGQYFDAASFTTKYFAVPGRDLCFLQIDTFNRKSFPTISYNAIQHTEEVMSFGYPLGFKFNATLGNVVGFDTGVYSWIDSDTKLIKIDSLIDGGNSGGPTFLVETGELACINFALMRYYDIHAHCISADYISELDLNSLQFVDALDSIVDMSAYTSVTVFTGTGYLDGYYDMSFQNVDLQAGKFYRIITQGDSATTKPVESAQIALYDPDGNYIQGIYYFEEDYQQALFKTDMSGNYSVRVITKDYHYSDYGYYKLEVQEMVTDTTSPSTEQTIYSGNFDVSFSYNDATPGLQLKQYGGPFVALSGDMSFGQAYSVQYYPGSTFRINGVWNEGTSAETWLDQKYQSQGDSITVNSVDCGMSWVITEPSLIVYNGVGGGNFEFFIMPYDTNGDGAIVNCVMTDVNGNIVTPQ